MITKGTYVELGVGPGYAGKKASIAIPIKVLVEAGQADKAAKLIQEHEAPEGASGICELASAWRFPNSSCRSLSQRCSRTRREQS